MKTNNNREKDNSQTKKTAAGPETAKRGQQEPAVRNNPVKDPDEWTTGDEPMTGPQQSYLQTLAQEAGEEVDENLSKAEASKKIEELQQKTGRGL